MTKKSPSYRYSNWLFASEPISSVDRCDRPAGPKMPAKRVPPTQPSRARSPFLPQQNKQSSPRPTLCAWRHQAKIANGMAITIGNLLCQEGSELLNRIPGCYLLMQFLVLRQKLDLSFCHLYETTLSDRWAPGV